MIYEVTNTAGAEGLFEGWEETLIWSCLQGVMGSVFVDDLSLPTAAMAMVGDFCFFAGEPNRQLVEYKPDSCKQGFMIMVPQSRKWGGLIELVYRDKATKVTRYAIKKEPNVFDIAYLNEIVETLPEKCELRRIDATIFDISKKEKWMHDLTSQYDSFEQYEMRGALGVVLIYDNEVVSGASAYSVYKGGIEIEIDTREDQRRNGYAFLCGAKLILECLKENKYPSWDAQNKWS
ncbi:MAG: GNAT family N-acetyltransferase, partial [Lachnospiraceae bacterium]|nr:GNAT family N-acetyltransferase [Lachnospiraceae bacterium]